jgi:hypothetical protein
MNITIYTLLLATAVVGTGLLIYAGARGRVGDVTVGATVGLVLSAAMLILWGWLAVSALDLTLVSNGTTITRSYESLAWLAVGGGAVAAASLFQSAVEAIRETGGI